MVLDPRLLERISQSLRTARSSLLPNESPAEGSIEARGEARSTAKDSILARAAELYGSKRGSEDTPPTGFDPAAAALFEALVEGAYLVANADGEFDREERAAFAHVVLTATDGRVSGDQLTALLADLKDQLAADGHDQRVQVVGKTVARPEAQREVLRVAALVAHISGGISEVERATMDRLATSFGLEASIVEAVIGEARALLDG
ncbi:MAG: tellurite resistance TerB family protein [Polyangiaceae bacterium]|nr:tellurite resistance TerB family protein [Polyangiaceae bacterium]MBK8941117.1 tellurite resistance TerB family protein [Polyangiaceae bacterium]